MKNLHTLAAVLLTIAAISTAEAQQSWSNYSGKNVAWRNARSQGRYGQATASTRVRQNEIRHRSQFEAGRNGVSAGAEGQVNWVRATQTGKYRGNSLRYNGQRVVQNEASGTAEMRIGANGSSQAQLNHQGLAVQNEAFVGQEWTANGNARTRLMGGSYGVNGAVRASVGADARANAAATRHGLQGELGAFAGDRIAATGGADVMGVGAGGTAEGWAGVGAEANGDATYRRGKLRFQGNLGAGLGVGGKAGLDVTVDTNRLQKDSRRFVKTTSSVTRKMQPKIKKALSSFDRGVTRDAKKVSSSVSRSTNKATSSVKKTASRAKKKTKKTVKKIGKVFGF